MNLELDPAAKPALPELGFGACVAPIGEAGRLISFPDLPALRVAELTTEVNELIKLGRADDALVRLEWQGAPPASANLLKIHGRLARGLKVLRARAPERLARGESTSVAALGCVLDILLADRRAPAPAKRLGGMALMTGHLGAGGAEMQMARTAEMLTAAATAKQTIAGVKIAGPVHVVVKSLTPEPDRKLNFHLPRLSRKNIPVWEVSDLEAVETDDLTEDEDVAALLPLLHASIRRGLRLTPWFRQHKIDVAYIWQDNPILHFALPALLAGVPRLVLNFRGLPPVLRWKEHLDEYIELYSLLAQAPGVTVVSNSAAVASAYSDWIKCPRERFHVIHNGGAHNAPHPSDRELGLWSKFEARTADANITVGGIFRMHPNKRPLEWIRFARRFLDTHPRARFILIGTGIFFEAVKELAETLGLTSRLLMMRQTEAGEFWLKRMDVFVLLSRYEGTPNVLIEAQLAGVPVVCTPVANAADTFVEGVTGLATASTDHLDVDDVVAKVDEIVAYARSGSAVHQCAKRHVANRFSTRSMIEHTVRILAGKDGHCCVRARGPGAEAGAVGP